MVLEMKTLKNFNPQQYFETKIPWNPNPGIGKSEKFVLG